MTREYLKKATLTAASGASDVHDTVVSILKDIEEGGDAKAMEYAAKFDKYEGNVILTQAEIEAASALVPEKLKADIQFAHDNVKRFAELQKSTVADVEMEIQPGYVAGQKAIPVDAAGCYAPGGRYSHIASAIMTVTTAKVAGCKHITACQDVNTLRPVLLRVLVLVWLPRSSTQRIFAVQIRLWRWVAFKALRLWRLVYLACQRPIFWLALATSLWPRQSVFCLAVWASI